MTEKIWTLLPNDEEHSPCVLSCRLPLSGSSAGRNHLREPCCHSPEHTPCHLWLSWTFDADWFPWENKQDLFICLEHKRAPAWQLQILTYFSSHSYKTSYCLFILLLWYLQYIPVRMAGFCDGSQRAVISDLFFSTCNVILHPTTFKWKTKRSVLLKI